MVRLHPSAPSGGVPWSSAPRLHRARCGFDSRRLHSFASHRLTPWPRLDRRTPATRAHGGSNPPGVLRGGPGRLTFRLRSVNGKHAPFVRPRCGFDSCRRLQPCARSSVGRALPCDGRCRWFESSRAFLWTCGVRASTASSNLVSRGSNPRGSVGSSVFRRACRLCRCAPTDALGSSEKKGVHGGNMVSPRAQSSRAGSVGLSGERPCGAISPRVGGSTPRPRPHSQDRDESSAVGWNDSGYRLSSERSRVRIPPGALRRPGSSVEEHFRFVQHDRSRFTHGTNAARAGSAGCALTDAAGRRRSVISTTQGAGEAGNLRPAKPGLRSIFTT